MGKLEKEVKILNISVERTKEKLEKMNAKYKGSKKQKIYTYDIPTIYFRYLECIELLNTNNELLITTTIQKLRVLLEEFVDLVDNNKLKIIYDEMKIKDFEDVLKMDKQKVINAFTKSKTFTNEISNYLINPNKWVRLRQSNEKVELTIKHVFDKSNDSIQKVKEYEIEVTDLEEANNILKELGVVKRSYQEKIRHSFEYKTAEIEIDEWPLLDPYMEIECDDSNIIDEVIEKLNYKSKEIVSLNTEQLYKRKNIDILKMSELKF